MPRRIPVDIGPITPRDRGVRYGGKPGGKPPGGGGGKPGGPGRPSFKGGGKVQGKGKSSRTDPKVRARAEELAGSGMPFQLAMAVALSRVSLNDALERMQRQEKVQKLMDEHELSRALATQIVIGHASLDAVLSRRRLQGHREVHRGRSCLDEAFASGAPIALALHGNRKVIGKVAALSAYSVTVLAEEGGTEEIHKLQLKYAYAPDDFKKVRKTLKNDKELSKAPIAPIERPQDRYTCSDKRLFRYMDSAAVIQATLLEGEQFRGHVTWFSRYEFGFSLKGGDAEVTIFRHCLHDLSDA
jgi:hypothetical protein